MKVLIVIPALNEEVALPKTLSQLKLELPTLPFRTDVLVVDDGSIDTTSMVARRFGTFVCRHPVNCGVGAAMKTGFRFASLNDYDVVVQVDADGQHPIREIQSLVSELEYSDITIGSRFLAANYHVSILRKAAMNFLRSVLWLLTGQAFTDPTSGFRAANRNAIAFFAVNYPSEYLGDTVESIQLAKQQGLSIMEIPVDMSPRVDGNASHSPARAGLHVFRATGMLLINLRIQNSATKADVM